MAQQDDWKYCYNTTIRHRLAENKYIQKIHDVILSEGGNNSPLFINEVCINIDKIERDNAIKERRDRVKTMDTFFGISSGNNKQVVLCEYRLRFKNPKNIKKGDFDNKINNSKYIVGHSPTIHKNFLFIFNEHILHQAKYRIRRLYSNKSYIKALSIVELKDIYFS